ncbi:MAG: TerC family protein [Nitrolancea sp.]
METTIWFWILFNLFVVGMLVLDLGLFNRQAHAVSMRQAAIWSGVWIALALLFNVGIYLYAGSDPAMAFFSGYLLEKSLAVDNIFVFVLIFGALAVPTAYQHRVLFFGVLGALIMRGLMIASGSYLIEHFDWTFYLFGAFLVFTAVRMLRREEAEIETEEHRLVRLLRRVVPITDGYRGSRFFQREGGRLMATPLFVAVLLIEGADLIFALDSIPAVFAVTRDPFLVYSSNIFAILGLRSLYFLMAGVVDRVHLLKYGLAVVLGFVGVKMLVADFIHVPIGVSLGVITTILGVSILLSLYGPNGAHSRVANGDRTHNRLEGSP